MADNNLIFWLIEEMGKEKNYQVYVRDDIEPPGCPVPASSHF